ncbi:MAG: phosphate ABC transporter permease PstA [Gammaproteobacteria bacterium]
MMKQWFKSGAPWIWLNAAAVSISIILVFGLLGLIAVRGLGHFWPAQLTEFKYQEKNGAEETVIGEIVETDEMTAKQTEETGLTVPAGQKSLIQHLIKTGNRDLTGMDFRWLLDGNILSRTQPDSLLVIERREWGNFYGYLTSVKADGREIAAGEKAWSEAIERLGRALDLFQSIEKIQKQDIGSINYRLEQLRLREKRLKLENRFDESAERAIAAEKTRFEAEYAELQTVLADRYRQIRRDSIVVKAANSHTVEIPLAKAVRIYRPNAMNPLQKIGFYFSKFWEFLADDPREANTEGGVLPAIFGTVMMVIIMSVVVTPFGVIAAVYLREYAAQGLITRIIRIAVNNLAGVPSIVYGVFGLGFFVYFLGGNIDRLFYPEALPSPTFGTPGILWSSLTLALLTLPVVIVSTEEGLARIPKSIRESSLALGATKAETLWRTVLPMASPAMMTGLILAVARAAGEVAPLMLVGVVKLAPTLPLDANFPFLHLDRKFMHLGFHIYDVGFQSPNVEAARPLVYATSLLLVIVIVGLNLTAVAVRNNLREKFRVLES